MIRLFLIVSSIYASVSATATSCIEADLILHHGNIYTGKTDRSFLGSIASKGSKITYVGKVLSDADIACSNANIIKCLSNFILLDLKFLHILPTSFHLSALQYIYRVQPPYPTDSLVIVYIS